MISLLDGVDFVEIKNDDGQGIDAFLKEKLSKSVVPVKIQRKGESFDEAISILYKASNIIDARYMVIVVTDELPVDRMELPYEVIVIPSVGIAIKNAVKKIKEKEIKAKKKKKIKKT